jgi:hypothetical protein
MDLDDVAHALAEKLDTIPGLRVHSEVPQSVAPPAAVIGMGSGDFVTLDDAMSVDFGVLLLLSAAANRNAQTDLRSYCAKTGEKSIKAAIEQDSHDLLLAGVSTGANAHCHGWEVPAVINLGGTDYIGVEFKVSVAE